MFVVHCSHSNVFDHAVTDARDVECSAEVWSYFRDFSVRLCHISPSLFYDHMPRGYVAEVDLPLKTGLTDEMVFSGFAWKEIPEPVPLGMPLARGWIGIYRMGAVYFLGAYGGLDDAMLDSFESSQGDVDGFRKIAMEERSRVLGGAVFADVVLDDVLRCENGLLRVSAMNRRGVSVDRKTGNVGVLPVGEWTDSFSTLVSWTTVNVRHAEGQKKSRIYKW